MALYSAPAGRLVVGSYQATGAGAPRSCSTGRTITAGNTRGTAISAKSTVAPTRCSRPRPSGWRTSIPPAAASLLYWGTAEGILVRGSSKHYGYAAHDVRHSASPAGRVVEEGGIDGTEVFVARLQREHGRKCGFWQLRKAE